MRHFELQALDRGLTFNTGKCEVIPSAGQQTTVPEQMFPGWQWRREKNFKLLGTPIGDVLFTEAHTDERRALAAELLKSVGKYDHCQGALQLLRHCTSWSRLVYLARTVPPELHETVLDAFEQNLRVVPSSSSWATRCLSFRVDPQGSVCTICRTGCRVSARIDCLCTRHRRE